MINSTFWTVKGDIPDDLRRVLDAESEQAETENRALIANTVASIRSTRLAVTATKMVLALRRTHPNLPKVKVFRAVSLVTGISESHVRDLYYEDRKKPGAIGETPT